MVLAEALLRVPDAATADRLIEDKLAAGDWSPPRGALERAAGVGLGLDARRHRAHHPAGETPENILESLVKRLGLPAVRTATRQAMRLLGSHFVLGQTIEEALRRAGRHPRAALLVRHAGRGRAHGGGRRALFRRLCGRDRRDRRRRRRCARCRTGRAFRSSSRRCIRASRRCRARACSRELVPRRDRARPQGAQATISISPSTPRRPTGSSSSLDVIGAVLADPSLRGWDGFGLAVQAYQKRAAGGDRLARRRPRTRSAAG